MSSMSFLFSFERIMSVIPARFAARIFSLIPPTGSTLPRRVISPVMAMWSFTFRLVNDDANDVTIVMPADGPSLGIAPSGTCICTLVVSNTSGLIPYFSQFALRYCNAITADSFITSPRLPVSVSFSAFAFDSEDSINKISPPTAVHASPVTTPMNSFPS